MANKTQEAPIYNGIPKQVLRKDFNRYIDPHLKNTIVWTILFFQDFRTSVQSVL